MKQTIINTLEDITWLYETHFPNIPENTKCVVLYGNEDSPEAFDVYESEEPSINDVPRKYIAQYDENNTTTYKEVTK